MAEYGVGGLQPDGGVEAEVGDAGIGGEIVGVGVPVSAPAGQAAAGKPRQQTRHQQEQQRPAAHALLGDDATAQENTQHQRDERQQQEGQAGQHHIRQHGLAEAGHHVAGHIADKADGKIGLEIAAAAVFHADQHRPHRHDGDGDDGGRRAMADQIDQQAPEQAGADGKQHHQHQRAGEEIALPVKGAEQQLMV